MKENCVEHSCADCLYFNWDRFKLHDEECPCYECSHGWKRDIEGSECKHLREYDAYRIEQNIIFISKHRHVLDMLKGV